MSRSELMPYLFEGNEIRVTKDENGEPWFVAKDVALALGYEWNGSSRIAHVPTEWRGVTSVVTPSGTQEMLTLSEPGLYFFLGRSDKPAALPFQKWLASEVLPALRKSGRYELPGAGRPPLREDMERAMLGMSRRYRDKAMYYAMQMCKSSGESMANLEDCFLRVCWLLGGTQAEIPDDSPLGRAEKWAKEHLTPAPRSRGIQSIKVYNAYLEWTEKEEAPAITLTAFGKMMRRSFPVHHSSRIYYLVQWRERHDAC